MARRASRGLTVSLPAAAQTTCQAARGRRQNTSSRPARLPRSSGRGGTHALSLPSLRRRVVRRGRALECHSRGEASKGSAVAHDWPAALAGLRAEVRTHGTPPDARQPGLPTGSVRRVWGPERVLSVWPAGNRVSDAGRKSAIDKTFNRLFPFSALLLFGSAGGDEKHCRRTAASLRTAGRTAPAAGPGPAGWSAAQVEAQNNRGFGETVSRARILGRVLAESLSLMNPATCSSQAC